MKVVDTRKPKLCHAKPGSVIQLLEDDQPAGDFYLVAVMDVKGKHAGRDLVPHGLYDDERPMFLVSLNSGKAISMPHLSSRVEITYGAEVVISGGDGVTSRISHGKLFTEGDFLVVFPDTYKPHEYMVPVLPGTILKHSEFGDVLVQCDETRGWHYLRWGYAGFGADFENLRMP